MYVRACSMIPSTRTWNKHAHTWLLLIINIKKRPTFLVHEKKPEPHFFSGWLKYKIRALREHTRLSGLWAGLTSAVRCVSPRGPLDLKLGHPPEQVTFWWYVSSDLFLEPPNAKNRTRLRGPFLGALPQLLSEFHKTECWDHHWADGLVR